MLYAIDFPSYINSPSYGGIVEIIYSYVSKPNHQVRLNYHSLSWGVKPFPVSGLQIHSKKKVLAEDNSSIQKLDFSQIKWLIKNYLMITYPWKIGGIFSDGLSKVIKHLNQNIIPECNRKALIEMVQTMVELLATITDPREEYTHFKMH